MPRLNPLMGSSTTVSSTTNESSTNRNGNRSCRAPRLTGRRDHGNVAHQHPLRDACTPSGVAGPSPYNPSNPPHSNDDDTCDQLCGPETHRPRCHDPVPAVAGFFSRSTGGDCATRAVSASTSGEKSGNSWY